MASHPATTKPASRETLYAIIASFVIALVLATVISGSPLRALRLAYLDYSHTPAGGGAKADDTRAPANLGSTPGK